MHTVNMTPVMKSVYGKTQAGDKLGNAIKCVGKAFFLLPFGSIVFSFEFQPKLINKETKNVRNSCVIVNKPSKALRSEFSR